MKHTFTTAVLCAIIILSLTQAYSHGAETPNIVFIMADDLGPGDIAHYTNTYTSNTPMAPTPNIDSLATDGLWFTDGHAPTALCAPSRYAVMSGNLNYRSYAPWGVWGTFQQNAIASNEATLGSVTKAAGYTTGFIGKWHLGSDYANAAGTGIYRGTDSGNIGSSVDLSAIIGGGPSSMGFDYSLTLPCGIQGPIYLAYENESWYPLVTGSQIIYLDENSAIDPEFVSDKGPGMGDSNWDAREMGKILSAKAVDFINNNAGGTDPFFLCYWSPTVHLPHCPPVEFDGVPIAGTTPTDHLDMVRDLDQQVARIVNALKDNNIYNDTLIIFTSDNGGLWISGSVGHDSSGAWRGTKNSPYEGGSGVPFIAVWPGHIQAGSVSNEPVLGLDIVATLAALVGTEIPDGQAMDSLNLLPLLTGQGTFVQRDYIMQQSGSSTEVMFRQDGWKLIMDTDYSTSFWTPMSLFDLVNNPTENESYNFVNDSQYQSLVQDMKDTYLDIRTSGISTLPENISTPYSGTPVSLPGLIEAEEYDLGGEGIAYHDTTAGNAGNEFRTDDVDIEARDSGYNVGYIADGEWLNYTVNAASGIYDLTARVASEYGDSSFTVYLDDTQIATVNVPDTTDWSTFDDVVVSGITITGANDVILRIEFSCPTGGQNLNWIEFTPTLSTPYSGTPANLPGKLQVEEYDLGGEGVAYHDTTAGNNGSDFRTDDVDITAQYGGHVVAWVTEEEWLKYTVDAAAGTYDITARASTGINNRNLTLTLDGNTLGTINILNMGWSTFQTVTLADVVIPAASSGVLELSFNGGLNVDWIDFTLLKGDADFNGMVDSDDLYILASQWLTDCLVESPCGDLDYSGKVTLSDLAILSAGWMMP